MHSGVTTQVITFRDEHSSPKRRYMYGDVMGIVRSEYMRSRKILISTHKTSSWVSMEVTGSYFGRGLFCPFVFVLLSSKQRGSNNDAGAVVCDARPVLGASDRWDRSSFQD